jgi:pilus assembly protein Flp/PilA
MFTLWQMVKSALKDQKGQGMVEYGLILALVAVIAMVGLGALGGDLNTFFNGIKDSLGLGSGGSGTTTTTP